MAAFCVLNERADLQVCACNTGYECLMMMHVEAWSHICMAPNLRKKKEMKQKLKKSYKLNGPPTSV